MNREDYEALLPLCNSKKQRERVLACIAYGNQTKAGKALGVDPKRMSETLAGIKRRIAKRRDNQIVGIIGDTHLPYELNSYLDWIQGVFQKNKVNRIIHIGDLFDHHALSFHDSEPALKGSHGEYIDALEHLEPWKKHSLN